MLLNAVRGPIREWQDPQGDEDSMKPCQEVTIEGIDQALYDKLLAEATAAGASFYGGTVALKGCTFAWNYDAPSSTLHFTCLGRPFIFGCGEVESRIRELVAKARTAI